MHKVFCNGKVLGVFFCARMLSESFAQISVTPSHTHTDHICTLSYG